MSVISYWPVTFRITVIFVSSRLIQNVYFFFIFIIMLTKYQNTSILYLYVLMLKMMRFKFICPWVTTSEHLCSHKTILLNKWFLSSMFDESRRIVLSNKFIIARVDFSAAIFNQLVEGAVKFYICTVRTSTFSLRSVRVPFAFFTALPWCCDRKIRKKLYLILRKLHRTRKIFLKIMLRPCKQNLLV